MAGIKVQCFTTKLPPNRLEADRGIEPRRRAYETQQFPELTRCYEMVGVAGFEPAAACSQSR